MHIEEIREHIRRLEENIDSAIKVFTSATDLVPYNIIYDTTPIKSDSGMEDKQVAQPVEVEIKIKSSF